MNRALIKSPLNYTGGKYKLLPQLLPLFPKGGNSAIDLFCGAANIGINLAGFNKVVCFDKEIHLIKLLKLIQDMDSETLISEIEQIIHKYGLSDSSQLGVNYYKIIRNEGLSKVNRIAYLKLRDDYNRMRPSKKKTIFLFVLIIFGFNYQLRFNKKGQFNIPVGKGDFNQNIKNNLIQFSNKAKEMNIIFQHKDFRNLSSEDFKNVDFVYCDPPYLLANASYNENNGWTENDERNLLRLLDYLNHHQIKFALSNILYNDQSINTILLSWAHKYRIHKLKYNYNNSNYHKKIRIDQEVLITNY